MELILNRPLQWFLRQLHANELPLRQNRKIVGWMREATCSFNHAIECMLFEVTNKKDLSPDQLYLMKICEAINCGHCRESLSKRNPAKFAAQDCLQP
ncbi:hypothetical protein AVEN_257467-1 [Araneus ventricosus]|uniref:Uncharacterized protein n=1 Tax=Araneus ventricosus TaxID=182803 RepID=A0A4Y2UV77_ARAVE|nr:hypothetical protein AVEN_257467-1 [Araneus ventricosus]